MNSQVSSTRSIVQTLLSGALGLVVASGGRAAEATTAGAKPSGMGGSMVVMGVSQRPGDDLFFGDTASAVLAGCNCPIVLLASERMRGPSAAEPVAA
jgi:nucleotide-binding universal stress UspA family protein